MFEYVYICVYGVTVSMFDQKYTDWEAWQASKMVTKNAEIANEN